MTFELATKTTVHERRERQFSLQHTVYSRDRILTPGTLIKARGYVVTDDEALKDVRRGIARIKVDSDEELSVAFEPRAFGKFLGLDKDGFWDVLTIPGPNIERLLYADSWHELHEPSLPSAYTLQDMIHRRNAINRKVDELGERKTWVTDETKIEYTPTLPTNARR